MSKRVELRCAGVPFIGAVAEHYWFVLFDEASGERRRWEVWQTANAGGTSFGHVHCDLKHPDAGVGGGPMRVAGQWAGEDALKIFSAIRESEKSYPFIHRYRAWPGPNSNTFIAWVLRRAGIEHRLPWRAIGKGYALAAWSQDS